jgi:hypothetical protein
MTHLGILLAIVALGVIGVHHVYVPILASVTLWILVPSVAAQSLTHLHGGYHPSSLIVIIAFLSRSLTGRLGTRNINNRVRVSFLILGLVVALAIAQTIAQGGGRVSVPLINDLLAPVLLFVLIVGAANEKSEIAHYLKATILGLACLEAGYSILQRDVIRGGDAGNIPFASSYSSQYWFVYLDRPVGTLDHPLVLGMVLASSIPLAVMIKRPVLQYPIALLLFAGTLASSARAAIIFAIVAVAYLILRPTQRWIAKAWIAIPVGLVIIAISQSSLGTSAKERLYSFGESDNSTYLRVQAYSYFLRHWSEHIFLGGGVGSASLLGENGILGSSLENPMLIDVFDLGVLCTLLLLIPQISATVSRRGGRRSGGVVMAAIGCFAISLTFNSTTVPSAAAPLLWTLIALCEIDRTTIKPLGRGQPVGDSSWRPVDREKVEIDTESLHPSPQ